MYLSGVLGAAAALAALFAPALAAEQGAVDARSLSGMPGAPVAGFEMPIDRRASPPRPVGPPGPPGPPGLGLWPNRLPHVDANSCFYRNGPRGTYQFGIDIIRSQPQPFKNPCGERILRDLQRICDRTINFSCRPIAGGRHAEIDFFSDTGRCTPAVVSQILNRNTRDSVTFVCVQIRT